MIFGLLIGSKTERLTLCNRRTKDIICKDYDYAFAEFRYPGVPEMNIHVVDETPFWIDDIKIESITVMHHKLP